MAKSRKKRGTSRRRWVSFCLFLVMGGVVFVGRHELLWGLKGYLLDRIDFLRIESHSDLPRQSEARVRPAVVSGIPDYKNEVRFPYKKKTLTCYRMVGFENRLCVCAWKGLREPKAIDEVIQSHTVGGRLEELTGNPLEDRLRSLFLKTGGIRLAEDAFLLSEVRSPLPSVFRVGLLSFCLILCCFFAYRLIKQ